MKQQKQFKKEIRLWAGKAYERLLNKALRELDDAFSQWRANHLSPFALSDKIHEFHDGGSRFLYNLDGPTSWEQEKGAAQVPHKSNVLQFCIDPHSFREIMDHLGLKHRVYVLTEHIQPLVEEGLLVLTIPEKPKSSRQKYVTTEQGRGSLKASS